jgi:protein TonB
LCKRKRVKITVKGKWNAVSSKNEQADEQYKKEKFKNLKFSDLAFKASQKVIKKQTKKRKKNNLIKKGLAYGKATGLGLGSNNDYLEDMPLGDFTKLNTQEYEYYGFYHRVRQKLEQFWGANIQQQAERIFKQGRSLASESNLITGLTISLNSRGEIVDILVKSTSGVKELDEAAIESFNQAGPFPNPPKGMVKSGLATIEWGFVVNT